jgi:pyrimidine-nucleoside phosphorylase
MVLLARKADSLEQARAMLVEVIHNGKALATFKRFLSAQGGDASVVDNPSKLPQATYIIEVPAKEEGYVSEIIADEIGTAAMLLGAGRATKESRIDLAVGLVLRKKVGDFVKKGDSLVTLFANNENTNEVVEKIYASIKLSKIAIQPQTLIYDVITE